MRTNRATAASLAFCLTAQLSGTMQDDGTLRLRADTRVVQIDVMVRDSKGKPVEDLTKSDFTVFDNGKPRAFSIFSVNRDPSGPGGEPAKPGTLPIRPALPPNIFTNIGSIGTTSHPPEGHSTIIVLDGMATCFEDFIWARKGVDGLMPKVPGDEKIALYVLQKNDGLGMLQDYTLDRTRLTESLAHYTPPGIHACALGIEGPEDMNEFYRRPASGARAPGPGGPPPPDASKSTLRETSATYQLTSEALRLSLQALAEKLRSLPGRKTVFWLTQGFPPAQLRGMNKIAWDKTFSALNDANIAVNTVDQNGMGGPPRGFAGAITTMQTVAEETGGQAYFHRNDLDAAMASGIADSRHSYTLGFYLTGIDGQYHDLKIKVDRPDLDLNYRRGYLAQSEAVRDSSARKSDLAAALLNQQDMVGVGITVSIEVKQGQPRSTLMAHVKLDPTSLSLKKAAGGWDGKFEELFLEQNDAGREVGRISVVKVFEIDAAHKTNYDSQGAMISQAIPLAAGATKLSIVVRDTASGRIGSLTIPLE